YVGFSFLWSNTDTTPTTTTPLSAGVYTLTATNTGDNCKSNPVSVTINNNQYIPVINITETPHGSCGVANPNGRLGADINENGPGGPGGGTNVVLGYSFAWTNRGNPYGAVIPPTPNPFGVNGIDKLVANKYYEV